MATTSSGTVTSFDEARGLGVVTADDGMVIDFHCIDIADGTRTIAVGTRVRFELHPKLGRLEAARVERA